MDGIIDRINQSLTQFEKNGSPPSSLRLGRFELEELASLHCEFVPSEKLRNMSESERKKILSEYYEVIRLFQTGERVMGIPIVKVDAESCLEVI